MWIYIWAVFAVLMLGFAAWNMTIMFQQKKAWRALADKLKLNYESTGFMTSPSVSGKVDKAYFSLFSGVQKMDDVRGERFVTAIEFTMGAGMPTGAALGTAQMKPFIDTLIFNDTYDPEIKEWQDDYVLRARDEEGLKAYLTDERLKVLCGIFKMKGATVLFFFDELEAVLRVETSDPLRNAEHLQKIIKRLRDSVKILTPTAEEKRRFQKLLRDEESRQLEKEKKRLEYDPDLEDHKIELELEDDDKTSEVKKVDAETELTLEQDEESTSEKKNIAKSTKSSKKSGK